MDREHFQCVMEQQWEPKLAVQVLASLEGEETGRRRVSGVGWRVEGVGVGVVKLMAVERLQWSEQRVVIRPGHLAKAQRALSSRRSLTH